MLQNITGIDTLWLVWEHWRVIVDRTGHTFRGDVGIGWLLRRI